MDIRIETEHAETTPRVIAETPRLLAVYKPKGMHTAPLREGESGTLVRWVIERYPEVSTVPGRKEIEPGVLHRLDRDTCGIVLFARDAEAFAFVEAAALEGRFAKWYRALCVSTLAPPPGLRQLMIPSADTVDGATPVVNPDWEPRAAGMAGEAGKWHDFLRSAARSADLRAGNAPPVEPPGLPLRVESRFRPYGPGRRRVAAVPLVLPALPGPPAPPERVSSDDAPSPVYRTVIEGIETKSPGELEVIATLVRGFRHQVRVHLASVGLPIVGDSLYGSAPAVGRDAGRARGGGDTPVTLMLTAFRIRVPDPPGRC